MKKSRLGAAAVSVTALALILTACGGSSGGSSAGGSSAAASSAPAATGGTFSVASEEPQNLISSNCYDLYCANVLNMMYTGLFRFETTADGTVVPVTTELVDSINTCGRFSAIHTYIHTYIKQIHTLHTYIRTGS
jgi:ABC-type oligopeptide transport system substrate-binding subunit